MGGTKEGGPKRRRETSGETVDRFVQFTKSPFGDNPYGIRGHVWWEITMSWLYGCYSAPKESSLSPRNVRAALGEAYGRGGLIALKAEFLTQVVIGTEIDKLGEAATPFFEKILSFK